MKELCFCGFVGRLGKVWMVLSYQGSVFFLDDAYLVLWGTAEYAVVFGYVAVVSLRLLAAGASSLMLSAALPITVSGKLPEVSFLYAHGQTSFEDELFLVGSEAVYTGYFDHLLE